jgi:hypothetical protein
MGSLNIFLSLTHFLGGDEVVSCWVGLYLFSNVNWNINWFIAISKQDYILQYQFNVTNIKKLACKKKFKTVFYFKYNTNWPIWNKDGCELIALTFLTFISGGLVSKKVFLALNDCFYWIIYNYYKFALFLAD